MPPRLAHFGERAFRRGRGRPVDQIEAVSPDDFVKRQPQKLRRGTVGSQDPEILVEQQNQILHRVKGSLPLRGGIAHLFLRPLAVGDVAGHLQQEAATSKRILAGVGFDREQCPILSPVPVRVEHGFTRRRPLRDGFQFRLLRIQVEGNPRRPNQFLPRITKALAGLPVHINNRPLLGVEDEEGVRRVVHKCAEACLALAQRFFGTLALGDIPHNGQVVSPVSIFEIIRADLDREDAAISGPVAALESARPLHLESRQ